MAVPLRNQQNMIGYGEAQVTQPKPSPFFDELNTQRQLAQKDRALDLQESGIKSKEKIAEQKANENRIAKLSQIKNVKNNYAPELVDKYNKEVDSYIKSATEDPDNIDLSQIFRFNTMAAKIDEMGTLASDVFKNNLKGDLVVSKDLEALLGGEYNLEGETIEDMIQTTASLLAQAAPNVDYNEIGKASSLELRNNIEGIKPENSSMFGITFDNKMEQIGNSTVDRTYANVNPEAANFYAKKKIENLPSTKIKIANMAMDDGVDLEENPEAYDVYLNELAKQVPIQTNFLIYERQAANKSEKEDKGDGVQDLINKMSPSTRKVSESDGEKESVERFVAIPQKLWSKVEVKVGNDTVEGVVKEVRQHPETKELEAKVSYDVKGATTGGPSKIKKDEYIPYSEVREIIRGNSPKYFDSLDEKISSLSGSEVTLDVTGLENAIMEGDDMITPDDLTELGPLLDKWNIKYEAVSGLGNDIKIDGVGYDLSDKESAAKLKEVIKGKMHKGKKDNSGTPEVGGINDLPE
jgi:hypothetical protein